MGVLPTMRSDKSEILPYNFKDYYAFIGLEKLSDHPSFRMFNHWHDAVEIIVPIRGHMVYSINGELVHLDENNGVFRRQHRLRICFCIVASAYPVCHKQYRKKLCEADYRQCGNTLYTSQSRDRLGENNHGRCV